MGSTFSYRVNSWAAEVHGFTLSCYCWSLTKIPIKIERRLQHAHKDRNSDCKQERTTAAGKTHPWTSQPTDHGETPGYLVDVAIVTGTGTVIMTQLLRYASGSEQLST